MYVKLVRVTTRPSLVILFQFVLLSWPIFGKVNMILGQTIFRSMGLKPTYAKEDLIPTLTAVNVAYTSLTHLGLFFFITPAFVARFQSYIPQLLKMPYLIYVVHVGIIYSTLRKLQPAAMRRQRYPKNTHLTMSQVSKTW